MLIEKKNFTRIYLINYLICFLPISLIIGNLATNINVVFICVFGIITYKFSLFKFDVNNKIFKYLIYGFFSYLVIITLQKSLPNLNTNILYKVHIIKSLFFLRFLILLLVVSKLVQEKKFNFKFFLLISTIASVIICFNVILNKTGITNYSLFGEEKIMGGFIQKFSLFAICFLNLFILNFKNKRNIFISNLLIISLFAISLFLAENRISLLIFISYFFLFALIYKQFRKYLISILILTSFLGIFFASIIDNKNHVAKWLSFVGNARQIVVDGPKIFYHGYIKNYPIKYAGGNLVTMNSGVQTWKENKIFGGGLKSYRVNCNDQGKELKVIFMDCNTHPHNYTIELLVDTGIIGLSFVYLILLLGLVVFLKLYKKKIQLNYFYLPFFLIFIFEIFPIRNTGSFFTTANAAYNFFIMAIFINLPKLQNLK